MKKYRKITNGILSLSLVAALAACDDDDPVGPPTPTSFTVAVENVSTMGTVNTSVLGGVVPLSPGVWAVFDGSNPAFTAGGTADVGTERIAEDGFTTEESAALSAAANVSSSGTFSAAGGMGPPIEPGETATFTVSAVPGDRLTFETMFVQSNDYFYAFGGQGIELFDGDDPISGNVTSEVRLWDAGTEVDEALGGTNQKPQQDPMASDIGPSEGSTILLVSQTQTTFTIPAVASVIRVTVTPN